MDDLLVYDRDIELVTHSGVAVTIKLYRLKIDPPDYLRGGCLEHWEKHDGFWNRVRRKHWHPWHPKHELLRTSESGR